MCSLSPAGSLPSQIEDTGVPACPLSLAGEYSPREEPENFPLSPVSSGSLSNLFLVRPYDWSDPMMFTDMQILAK